MGWGIRKSFRVGPMRVNLSKSGIGASVGLKGARVGISSRGQSYVAGGKGNLFFRENLSSGRNSTGDSSGGTKTSHGLDTTSFVDTGVCYPSLIKSQSSSLDLIPALPKNSGIGCLASVAILIFLWHPEISIIIGLLCLYIYIRIAFSKRKREKLCEDLNNIVKSLDSGEDLDRILNIVKEIKYSGIFRKCFNESMLLLIIQYASGRMASGQSLLKSKFMTSNLLELLDIPSERANQILKFNFDSILRSYLEDHFLDDQEEKHLRNYIEIAELKNEDISSQTKLINNMSAVRGYLANGLKPINVNIKLQRGEECYISSPARFLKEKQISRHQMSGTVYKEMGYEIDKEGIVYLTNKRLLLVHDGTSNLDLQKILNIDVYPETNLLTLARDGRERPFLITVPDVLPFAGILNQVWKSS